MDRIIHEEDKKTIPLYIKHEGKEYFGEVIGEPLPFNTYFDVRFSNAPSLTLIAIQKEDSEEYNWVISELHPFNFLVPFIGKEIEKTFKGKK